MYIKIVISNSRKKLLNINKITELGIHPIGTPTSYYRVYEVIDQKLFALSVLKHGLQYTNVTPEMLTEIKKDCEVRIEKSKNLRNLFEYKPDLDDRDGQLKLGI